MRTILFLITLIISFYSNTQTFSQEVVYGISSENAAYGDFDNDGDIDYVYVTEQTIGTPFASLVILERIYSAGVPAFFPNPWYIDWTQHPNSDVKVIDIDNDNDLDIVTGGFNDTIHVFYNNGLFNFTKFSYPVFGSPTDIEFADFDNDGFIDILYTLNTTNSIAILKNTGTSFIIQNITSTFPNPTRLKVFDMNNDGLKDFIVGGFSVFAGTGQIHWFKNIGGLNFLSYPISTVPTIDVFPIDFENDGDMDFASANSSGGKFVLWINDGLNNFTPNMIHTLGSGSGALAIRAGDMDNDGDMDFVTGDAGSGGLLLLRNNGAMVFTVDTITGSMQPSSIKIFDEDSDGDNDVLASSAANGVILFNNDLISANIEEFKIGKKYKLGPNPSRTFLTVQIENETNLENAIIVIYDNKGKEVVRKRIESISTIISTEKLLSGSYIIKIILENKISVDKIEIIK